MVIGVSACLTGAAVRYDGQGKNLPALQDWPSEHIELLPLCPEVGAGLPVPRPPVQLVASDSPQSNSPQSCSPQSIRALGRDDPALDVTSLLSIHAEQSVDSLQRHFGLCGYLWKSRSPSCGLGSTPLFDTSNHPIANVSGIQAARIREYLPWLAMAEDTDCAHAEGRARFLLQCRFVSELLWSDQSTQTEASDAAQAYHHLREWHAHYAFLHQRFPTDTSQALAEAVLTGDRHHYLALLHRACANEKAEHLLGLFLV